MEALLQKVETMPKVTALLTSLQGQQRHLLGKCLIMEMDKKKKSRVVLNVLQKWKNKNPSAERMI